jgi:hypothetical protein
MGSDGRDRRRARVTRDGDGEPIGCAVFLTGRQLRDLGLVPETTDAIEYVVTDGEIHLVAPNPEVAVEWQ